MIATTHSTQAEPKAGVSISLDRVCKSFAGNVALKNVSCQICPGEVFTIMGPSGSGKTVLLEHIIGLIKPDRGSIKVDGEIPGSDTLNEKVRMAMVFQNGGLLNSLSVEENVGLYLTEHHVKPKAEIKKIVAAELTELNLSHQDALKYPYELSGGMKKRVAIARAIVMEPRVVLYDEPTSELDPVVARTVVEEIRRVHKQHHQTTVIVTHDRELAFEIADHIAILINGELLRVGTPDEIRNSGDPQISNFLAANYKSKHNEEIS